MIRLGVQLAVAGGRRSVTALLLTALAIAVGTALLLLALTVSPAYDSRETRSELLELSSLAPGAQPDRFTAVRSVDDAFRDQRIAVVELAGVGVDPPRSPDLPLPAPGELLLSPALAELAAREPLLAQRYPPGSALLPDGVVPTPERLMAVRGIDLPPAADFENGRASAVVEFSEELGMRSYGPVVTSVIVVGAVAMLAPVVLFVATATRLTAASRERRMAALRLAGATNGQVVRLAGLEALLTGVVGAVAGLGVFYLVRPLATHVTIDERWYVSDLTPTPAGFAFALLGVPLAALLGAQLALRRVAVSPLGVGRRTRARPLGVWRLVPLVVAVPLFAVVVLRPIAGGGAGGDLAVTLSFLMVLGSLLLAGPWPVQVLGSLLARTGSAAAVLGGRRLTADPRAGFRAVAGVVVGTFVVAMFLTVAPAVQTELDPAATSGLAADAAVAFVDDEGEPALVREVLAGVPGVVPTTIRQAYLAGLEGGDAGSLWIGDCAAITRLTGYDPALCAPGRTLVSPAVLAVGSFRFYDGIVAPLPAQRVVALADDGRYDRPAAIAAPEAVVRLPRQVVDIVGFVADPDTIERARTALAAAELPTELTTAALRTAMASGDALRFERVLLGAMLGTFVVAGCSAAVAAATGLLERRRSFALLRLTGTPLGVLRRSAVVELAVPLVGASLASAALGVLTGRLIGLGGGADEPVPWLTLGGPLALGVATALVLGCLALPLIGRITGGDATRFE